MTQTNSADKLPLVTLPSRRHRWAFERRLAYTEFPDGNARTFKMCCLCDVQKITVHPSGGVITWNEWQIGDGPRKKGPRPECVGQPRGKTT